jgi:uncharacterized iron-regulated membrane protein
MSVTGVLMAYERQITNWAERSYRHEPAAGATRLPMDAVFDKATTQGKGRASQITWRVEPDAPVEVGFGRGLSIFVNPYTGEVLGSGAEKLRAFFQNVEGWHRWLGLNGASRNTAHGVTAACNLLFFFMICSGFYLWWPKSWSRRITWFNGSLSGKARDFNWHNTIGFWCSIPLAVMIFCSVVMSYPWANNLIYRLTGNAPPVGILRVETRGLEGRANEPLQKPQGLSLEALCEEAERRVPQWRTITLRFPANDDPRLSFTIDSGDGGRPDRRAQLTLNRITGEEVKWEPFSSNNAGRRLRAWIRFTHTGEAGGVWGETIAVIASLGACFLVWTGLSMAVRRFRGWMDNRRKAFAGPGAPEEEIHSVR